MRPRPALHETEIETDYHETETKNVVSRPCWSRDLNIPAFYPNVTTVHYVRVLTIANPSVVCNVRAPCSGGWLQVHYVCYWSPGAPRMATTFHQTYKLQTYTVLQGSTRPGWYLSSSSTETTTKHQISRRHNIYRIISTQEPISVFIFPSDYYWLEPTVMRTAPETISQLFPSVSALFTNSSIDILSRDTPAVITGWCPLLDIYRRTEDVEYFFAFCILAMCDLRPCKILRRSSQGYPSISPEC